jgi:hypothetical protein
MSCDICGSRLAGRYHSYCRTCGKKKGKGKRKGKNSPLSRHAGHLDHKRARSDNPNPHANAVLFDAPPTNTQKFPCPRCTFVFKSIGGKLDGAKRSEEELDQCQSRGSSDTNAYNFSRLKTVLQPWMVSPNAAGTAFDQMLHSRCLREKFGVGSKWPRRFYRSCCARVNVEIVTKQDILELNNFDISRIVLPFSATTRSRQKWFDEQADDVEIKLLPTNSFRINAGTAVGKAKMFSKLRVLFRCYVIKNSTLNGRVKLGHGIIRYLRPTIRMIKPSDRLLAAEKREEDAMEVDDAPEEDVAAPNAAGGALVVEEPVLSRAFRQHVKDHAPNGATIRLPSDRTIQRWFSNDFGSKSGKNYTGVYPGKTDWCSECARISREIASLKRTVQRYGMNGTTKYANLTKMTFFRF